MKEDAVLIIGSGMLQVPMIEQAHAMGLKVVCTDGNPLAPGFAIADAHYAVDTYDDEKTAWLVPHMSHNIIGVCTAGADVAPTVALAAKAAGTPGVPYHVAMRTHNKLFARTILSAAGLDAYQPRWSIHHASKPGVAIEYPCVVKPLSQRASRGVSLVTSQELLMPAIAKALEYGKEYLIEECLLGSEHSAELILDASGNPCWFNIVDRIFDYSSGTGIEIGHVNPTSLSPDAAMDIGDMVLDAAAALGIKFGPFKVDVMMAADGPKILECTARLSGGFDSQGTSPLTDRHPMRTVLELACGLPATPHGDASGYAACAAIIPRKIGILGAFPMLRKAIWTVSAGDRVGPASHNAERAGFFLCHEDTYEQAWLSAKTIADDLADSMGHWIE